MLQELYQELIIDHSRNPRQYGELADANFQHEGFNPLCGDKVTVYIKLEHDLIVDARFQGCGCAISVASASLLLEAIKGKTQEQAQQLFEQFQQLVTTGELADEVSLGKLQALAGVAQYPSRIKCATLALHTAKAAMANSDNLVTTE